MARLAIYQVDLAAIPIRGKEFSAEQLKSITCFGARAKRAALDGALEDA